MKKVTRRVAVVVALPVAALGLLVGGADGASAGGPHGYWYSSDYWYDYDYKKLIWVSDDDCNVNDSVVIGSVC